MPYVTGSASSMSDLLSALQDACTDNGWTLSGNVLHKGGCYAVLTVSSVMVASGHLSVRAGNGIDGSNNLTDPAPEAGYIGTLRASNNGAWATLTYPIEYHVHVLADPDEVWLWIRYDSEYWQWLCFGKSPAPGNAGTGNWHAAFIRPPESPYGSIRFWKGGIQSHYTILEARIASAQSLPCIPFLGVTGQYFTGNYAHGAIDNSTGLPRWSTGLPYGGSYNSSDHGLALFGVAPLLQYAPSAWNDEAILLPIQLVQVRASAKSSLIVEFAHSRLTRNTYIEPGEIVTLGLDKWKVYPAYRRNTLIPNGSTGGADHSGTFAIAVRYDGD